MVDLPACRQQLSSRRGFWLRRTSSCQGSGSRPRRRMTRSAARAGSGSSMGVLCRIIGVRRLVAALGFLDFTSVPCHFPAQTAGMMHRTWRFSKNPKAATSHRTPIIQKIVGMMHRIITRRGWDSKSSFAPRKNVLSRSERRLWRNITRSETTTLLRFPLAGPRDTCGEIGRTGRRCHRGDVRGESCPANVGRA